MTAQGASRARVTVKLGLHAFSFDSTSSLRDQLLASFVDAPCFGGQPVIGRAGQEPAIAWAWFGELVRARSDWAEVAGIALQHAVLDGPELARVAFADLMANERGMIALLRWTPCLVASFPSVRATRSGTGWGGRRDPTAEAALAEQRTFAAAATGASVVLDDWHGPFMPRVAPLPDKDALVGLLAETADDGRNVATEWGSGPWGWLFEQVVLKPWVREAAPDAMAAALARGRDPERVARAIIDWLAAGWDTWRFKDLLEDWRTLSRSWWDAQARVVAPGWRRTIAPAFWSGVVTLGDAVDQLARVCDAQLLARPLSDLGPRC